MVFSYLHQMTLSAPQSTLGFDFYSLDTITDSARNKQFHQAFPFFSFFFRPPRKPSSN